MRIGIDARLMYHQPAGISRYTLHLLRALATQTSREDFIVFQHRRHRQPIIQQRNFKRATLFAPAHGKLEQAMLPLELLRFSLDLLHCPDFIPPLYSPVPSVITVHDLAFLHWPRFLTESSAAYYGQIDRAVRKARHIIVPSQSTQQDLIRLLGVHESKVSVIYEAADPRFMPLELSRTRTEVCRRHHIPDSYIFFVSTLEPRKNVDGLLHAFRALRDRYHIADTGLVLAGSKGWLYEDTLALVEKLDLGECTFFLGRVSDEELHQLYVGARCHIHPALYEGFGLSPLEAMACGTPTIVSNVSSLPEIVGDAALLINPEDTEEMAVAMHRLLTDDDLHAELRKKGLQRSQCYDWEQAAKQTMDVYRKVSNPYASHLTPKTPTSTKQTTRL